MNAADRLLAAAAVALVLVAVLCGAALLKGPRAPVSRLARSAPTSRVHCRGQA